MAFFSTGLSGGLNSWGTAEREGGEALLLQPVEREKSSSFFIFGIFSATFLSNPSKPFPTIVWPLGFILFPPQKIGP